MEQKFSEFSEFGESDKSLKCELGKFKGVVCCPYVLLVVG